VATKGQLMCRVIESVWDQLDVSGFRCTDRDFVAQTFALSLVSLAVAVMDCLNMPEEAEKHRRSLVTRLDIIKNGSLALSRRQKVIYIDYLQLLQSRGGNRYEEVTNISKDLHLMAQRHGITVVALSQLTRPEKNKKGQTVPPSMASFRESGQIEQDADAALLLWPENPDDYRSDRKLKIGKNKEGRKGSFTLRFVGETQTMIQVGDDDLPGQTTFRSLPDREKVPFT